MSSSFAPAESLLATSADATGKAASPHGGKRIASTLLTTAGAGAAAAASALGPAAAAAAGAGDGGSPAPGSATTASQLLAVVTPGVARIDSASGEPGGSGSGIGSAGASAVAAAAVVRKKARISSAALDEAQPAAGLTSTQTFRPLSSSPPGSSQKYPMLVLGSNDEDDDGEVVKFW